MVKVLFVCLGNICRSPMAEGLFQSMILERNFISKFSCDSAGTSAYHLGELPDNRMRQTAQKHQINLTHRARQLTPQDFASFDYILAMDKSNFDDIITLQQRVKMADQKALSCEVMLMRAFDKLKTDEEVPDPYFGKVDGFEEVYQILQRCNQSLLDFLVQQHY